MNNLIAIRQISQNRGAYFKRKNKVNQEYIPRIDSHVNGPILNREQILGAIRFITQKINFNQVVDSMSQVMIPNHSMMDMVIVTCLTTSKINIWKQVLKVMATYHVKQIIAVWWQDEVSEALESLPDDILSKINFVYEGEGGLNNKWQRGILEASQLKSEAVMIWKEDTLVTHRYCQISMNKIWEGYELVGTRSWLSIFLQDEDSWKVDRPDFVKLCRYNEKRLDNEFIGSGRVISSYLLGKIKWNLYSAKKVMNDGLDKHSYYHLKQHQPKMYQLSFHSEVDIGMVQIETRKTEEGEMRDMRRPGSSWIGEMIQQTRYIDYGISQDIYEGALKIVYGNFGEYLLEMRGEI